MKNCGLLIVDVQEAFSPSAEYLSKLEALSTRYGVRYATVFVNQPGSLYRTALRWNGAEDPNPTPAFSFDCQQIFKKTGYGLPKEAIDALKEHRLAEWHLCGAEMDASVLGCAFSLWDAGIRPRILTEHCYTAHAEHRVAALKIADRQFGKPVVDGPPPLLFTKEESEKAYRVWRANCGPHSIAAACGKTLDQVREALPAFRGIMNPTEIGDALQRLGKPFRLTKHLRTHVLCEGINRLQWVGPWLNPGMPPSAAYQHTHYVAQRRGSVLCTATTTEWIPIEEWRDFITKNEGEWHITHHFEID